MVSLTSLLNAVTDQPNKADFLPKRCLRKRLNTNNCKHCLNACSSGALSLQGREIELNKTSCTGCMSCVAACPQDALTCLFDTDALLIHLARNSKVKISCGRKRRFDSNATIVPCLGIFSKQLLAAIGLSNFGSVIFDLSGCSECQNRQASEIFKENYNEVVEALSDILRSNLNIVCNSEEPDDLAVDRRSYLTNVKRGIFKTSKNYLAIEGKSIEPEATSLRRVPYKTQLVQNIVSDMETDSRERILSLFGNTLSINDDCNCCPLCKGICPTGAIRIVPTELGKKFEFQTLKCSGCGLCVEFCKKNSLTLQRHGDI